MKVDVVVGGYFRVGINMSPHEMIDLADVHGPSNTCRTHRTSTVS